MSARNRAPSFSLTPASHLGFTQAHEQLFSRTVGPMQYPVLVDHARGRRPGTLLSHPAAAAAIIEDQLAWQHHEIQAMLADNQRLAATHVALRQELEFARHEIEQMANVAGSVRADAESRAREGFEKAMKIEGELREVDAIRAELDCVGLDVQQLSMVRQELSGQVQTVTQDLERATIELQQVPVIKGEIEGMRQELRRARTSIEYEKNGYVENYEHGQAMEKNLIAMARELEMLRAELANGEKRGHAAAAVGNSGCSGYYGNPEIAYGVNAYPAGHGMNPVPSGSEGVFQYVSVPGTIRSYWGTYDMQRAHGRV